MIFSPARYTAAKERRFAALISYGLSPVLAPASLGFWPIVVAIIAGISAKEVVVSSTVILFRVSNINSAAGMEAVHAGLAGMGFGPLNAYCMMVFCLLYIPCAATIGVIKKESKSWKWTAFSVCFQVAVAYCMSFLIYQVGNILF